MFVQLTLLCLLVFLHIINASTTEILLILNNDNLCATDCLNTIFAYPLTIDTNSSFSLTLNLTDPVSNVLYSTIPYFDGEVDSLNDGVVAPPTAGTGPNKFLISHARNGLVNYNTVIVNTGNVNTGNSSLMIGDPTSDVSAFLPGIGQWPLQMKYLFHVDALDSYFGLSYVNVIDGQQTSNLHIYFWKDVDQFSATPEPVYTYQRSVPYCSNEFGVIGASPAIDQSRGIVYLNVAFWQSCDPKYSGWLLAYNASSNSVAAPVSYPNNVAQYDDWWIETIWSDKRQKMFSAIFYDWYNIIVDIVDVHTGANKTIISGSSWGTSMDGYNSKQVFDDFSGNWSVKQ